MKDRIVSDREYRLMKIAITIYFGLIIAFLFLVAKDVFADSLTEAQLQEYINATVQGQEITEADAIEGLRLTMHEVGDVFSGSNGIGTPQMPSDVNPSSNLPLIDVSTLPSQWYFEAYKARAIREGKPEMYYVNIAIEHAKAMVILARSAQRDQALCGDGFEIWEGSGICNVFTNHVSAEQNYNACLQTLDQSRAEYGACALNNFQLWDALQKKTQPTGCQSIKDGSGGFLWKPIA